MIVPRSEARYDLQRAEKVVGRTTGVFMSSEEPKLNDSEANNNPTSGESQAAPKQTEAA